MKIVCALFIFFLHNNLFSEYKSSAQGVHAFQKKIDDTKKAYLLEDVIIIENGKEEEIKVKFSASVPIEVWSKNWKKSGEKEKEYFNSIAFLLSIQAQNSLANPLSFQPFAKEFFTWDNQKFVCNYKMSGKNGLGNSVETSLIVKSDPDITKLNIPGLSN
jgi:hypothetical protein